MRILSVNVYLGVIQDVKIDGPFIEQAINFQVPDDPSRALYVGIIWYQCMPLFGNSGFCTM